MNIVTYFGVIVFASESRHPDILDFEVLDLSTVPRRFVTNSYNDASMHTLHNSYLNISTRDQFNQSNHSKAIINNETNLHLNNESRNEYNQSNLVDSSNESRNNIKSVVFENIDVINEYHNDYDANLHIASCSHIISYGQNSEMKISTPNIIVNDEILDEKHALCQLQDKSTKSQIEKDNLGNDLVNLNSFQRNKFEAQGEKEILPPQSYQFNSAYNSDSFRTLSNCSIIEYDNFNSSHCSSVNQIEQNVPYDYSADQNRHIPQIFNSSITYPPFNSDRNEFILSGLSFEDKNIQIELSKQNYSKEQNSMRINDYSQTLNCYSITNIKDFNSNQQKVGLMHSNANQNDSTFQFPSFVEEQNQSMMPEDDLHHSEFFDFQHNRGNDFRSKVLPNADIDSNISDDNEQHPGDQKEENIFSSHYYTRNENLIIIMIEEIQQWHATIKDKFQKLIFGVNDHFFYEEAINILRKEVYHWRSKTKMLQSSPTIRKKRKKTFKIKFDNLCYTSNCKKCITIFFDNYKRPSRFFHITVDFWFDGSTDTFLKLHNCFSDNREKYILLLNSDFSKFYELYTMQQKDINEILTKTNTRSTKFKNGEKMQIFKNLFHDFKFSNLELKMILIPEFLSLLISLLDKNITFYLGRNNSITLLFFFYLLTFNNFFDAFSNCYLGKNVQKGDLSIKQKKQLLIITLFIRIHLVEPILVLIFKHKQNLYIYCFHIFSSFVIENMNLVNKRNVDPDRINYLRFCDWCICIILEDIPSNNFLFCSDKNEIFLLMKSCMPIFMSFTKFITKIIGNLDAIRNSILQNEGMNNFCEFLNSFEKIFKKKKRKNGKKN